MLNRDTMSVRGCNRCVAKSKSGQQCTRSTCKYGPKCWQHTQLQDGLEVKKSAIPQAGMGLYAKKPIPKDHTVAPYTGEQLTKQQVDSRYPGNTLGAYTVKVNRSTYVDARKTNSGVARYANACRAPDQRAGHCDGKNAKLARAGPKSAELQATRPIPKGHEVYAGYGREYWQPKSTKRKRKRAH